MQVRDGHYFLGGGGRVGNFQVPYSKTAGQKKDSSREAMGKTSRKSFVLTRCLFRC